MLVESLYRRVVMAHWRSTYQLWPSAAANSCLPSDDFAAACAEMTHPHWVNRPKEDQSDKRQEPTAAVAAPIYDSGWPDRRSARLRCD
jgi:hypothetical protein